jgi:hypothetical protein
MKTNSIASVVIICAPFSVSLRLNHFASAKSGDEQYILPSGL